MKYFYKLSTAFVALFLVACSYNNYISEPASFDNQAIYPSISDDELALYSKQLSASVDEYWGSKEIIRTSDRVFVKYDNNYQTRAIINFTSGEVKFETIDSKRTRSSLSNIMVHILLMGGQIDLATLYLPKDLQISKNPFLKGQIIHKNKPITTVAQAEDFAQSLLSKVKIRLSDNHQIYYVSTKLQRGSHATRASIYSQLIKKYGSLYKVSPALISAIIEVESNFSPFAVSGSGAIGLMQIIPSTAGAHVFKVRKLSGKPNRNYLYSPENNISVGSHYLSIIRNSYFSKVTNPTSQRYLIISSYNAGAGGTLRLFDKNPSKAIEKINRMSSREIYRYLSTKHTSLEARRYLQKVEQALTKYR